MAIESAEKWVLKYRLKDGRGLWCITYENRPLWQLCAAAHPPSAHGGYSSQDLILRLHSIKQSDLIEATP